jgi:murein DD-endopeptidase MepM/ murein hydrolase activator NlpD
MENKEGGPPDAGPFAMSGTKTLVRIGALAALMVVQQLLTPLAGFAQVDPCTPIPIPELCDVVPTPGPSPSPSPHGNKGGKPAKGVEPSQEAGDGKQHEKAPGKHKKKKDEIEPGPLVVSSPNNSARLIEILSPLSRYGLHLQQSLLRVVGPFPVAGLTYWNDDWHACRDGCSRLHEGLDIFGEEGTPLVATADGVVTQKLVGETSGISIEIQDAQGIQYFYAHMSGYAEPINIGDTVQVGQLLGYLGHTGNAMYTPPHLHLEFQPGGVPAPPKPHVDQWIKIAEAEAEALAARIMAQELPEASDFRLTRLFDLTGGAETLQPGAERLLALAGIQPSVSSLEMARRLLGQMSWEIDWAGQTDLQLAELAQQALTLSSGQDLSGATPWAPFGITASPEVASMGTPEQGD